MAEQWDVTDPSSQTAPEAAEESRSKSIEEYLAPGTGWNEVGPLADLAPVRAFQPLLRELLLGGPDDFWVRLYVMRELLADSETSWTPDSLALRFGWLAEEPRRDVIRRLTRGGWLSFADGRYTVTRLGESATALTGLLGDLASRAGDLGLMVQSLKMAKEIGLDSRNQLDQLRHKLSKIGEQMERAYDSRSEHAILEARKVLEVSLPWVESARQVLERYGLDTPEEHERVRATHVLLSRLHHWASVLQRALNDIGKRRVHLGDAGGLTMRDVTAFLARSDVDTLLAMAEGSLHFPVEQRHVIVDNMLSEAEYEICIRELPEESRRGWTQAQAASAVEPEAAGQGPIDAFVGDLRGLIDQGRPVPAARFVTRDSWAASAYRFTLLALAGGRMDESDAPAEALGPGRVLATLPVDVEFDHRIREQLESEFASEMTSGRIVPRTPESADAAA